MERVRRQLLPEPDPELRDLQSWHEPLRAPLGETWRTADGGRLAERPDQDTTCHSDGQSCQAGSRNDTRCEP